MSDQTNELLDLSNPDTLREGRSKLEGAMTAEQASAYQRGDITPSQAPPPPPTPAPQQQQPAGQAPQPPAVPTNQPAPNAPPIHPTDSERVQSRINKLYAQKKGAEELVEQQAARIADLERRVGDFAVAQPQPVPAPQYDYHLHQPNNPGAVQGNGDPSQQAPLTRGEFLQTLNQWAQANEQRQAQIAALQNAQSASRAEAEGDFPDVFQNQSTRAVFDQILRSDPGIAQDPHGPYKAAAMARGFQDPLSAAGPSASPEARKQAIAGVGPSVPEGSQTPNDLATQYRHALDYAQQTGRDQDYARAYQLRDQLQRASGG